MTYEYQELILNTILEKGGNKIDENTINESVYKILKYKNNNIKIISTGIWL